MKKTIKVILISATLLMVLPLSCIVIHRLSMHARKIDIRDGNECWNVPPTAEHIFAKGSYLSFAAQFTISESEIVEYARSRNWELTEITNQIDAMTHLYFEDSPHRDHYVTVSEGLMFNNMSHRGGFVVVFDRKTQIGYIQFANN